MSYENIPKNNLQTSVLVRQGAADYYAASADPLPVLGITEAGAILEQRDTGLRFRWTGAIWVLDTSTVSIAEDYYSAVAKGKVAGERIVSVDGSNPEVSFAGGPEDLWALGGLYQYPVANEQWEVLSDNAADDAAGNGARLLYLTYLDENYVEQAVSFPTSGTVPSNLPVSNCFRPIDLTVISVGATGYNEGLITLRVAGGGADRIGMVTTNNSSLHGLYTVPAGYEAYFLQGYSSIAKGKEAEVRVALSNGPNGIFTRALPIELYESTAFYQPPAPRGPLPEKTDIRLEATAFNNNCRVSGSLQLHLVPTI